MEVNPTNVYMDENGEPGDKIVTYTQRPNYSVYPWHMFVTVCTQLEPGFSTPHVVVLFGFHCFEVRSGCSICCIFYHQCLNFHFIIRTVVMDIAKHILLKNVEREKIQPYFQVESTITFPYYTKHVVFNNHRACVDLCLNNLQTVPVLRNLSNSVQLRMWVLPTLVYLTYCAYVACMIKVKLLPNQIY